MNRQKNTVTKTTPQILKDNICTFFNLLNFLIALALAFVGAWSNMLFLLIIIINTVVGIVQELKAKRLVEKLSLLSMPLANVIRDDQKIEISIEEVQKGDILLLESGSIVCSDSIVVSGMAEVNEAILTGESETVVKHCGDQLLSGSTVIAGKCSAEVIHTADENYTSQVVNEVKKAKAAKSELLLSMKKVTKFTGFLIVPLGILLFLEAFLLRNSTIYQSVVSTSAGLLGMLPKGLVLLISIGLAAGIVRLSKKKVLVQDLYSLENLAHCDILCLDKTGTLTSGKMEAQKVELLDSTDYDTFKKLMHTYIAGTTDNNATFYALKEYFKGGERDITVSGIPFSSERKWSSIRIDDNTDFVIGAPERLAETIPKKLKAEMALGKRVLLAGVTNKIENHTLIPEKVTLMAAIILMDPLRANAESTIQYFYRQNVSIKVISGDNAISASAVAQRAGIKNAQAYVDMSQLPEEDIAGAAEKYTVFGRVTPQQKKQLIAAMQKKGHTVGMTGDGVNDLLAMKQADCSIAVGQGSDAARQTAQIVLLNSDFSVLKDVISEGRRVINNITKSAGVFFIKTIYSILISILCILFNKDFPFIPIQITLIDAVIEGFPAFVMSFEENNHKIKGKFLDTAVRAAFPNGLAIAVCCMLLFIFAPRFSIEGQQASLIMYLTVGVISIMGLIKASRPFNPLRAFLCAASAFGFTASVILFAPILKLPAFTLSSIQILPVMFVLGILLTLVIRLPDKTFYRGEKAV